MHFKDCHFNDSALFLFLPWGQVVPGSGRKKGLILFKSKQTCFDGGIGELSTVRRV